MWDSKYLVSIFPRRHCDHQCHNRNPDEEHMQLLSLNKISQFPLHRGTMGLSPGRWLSSYSPGAIIAAKPLPLPTLTHFSPLPPSASTGPPSKLPPRVDQGECHQFSLLFFLSSPLPPPPPPPRPPLLFFSAPVLHFLSQASAVRDMWLTWPLSVRSMNVYLRVLPHEGHRYQDGLSSLSRVCQGAVLIMRDFEGVCSKSHEVGWIPVQGKRARLFWEVG